jgi:hypothetical protein
MNETTYENPEQKAKDLAIASLAISISFIFMTAGLFSFVGSIIGHFALGKLRRVGNTTHTGFAIAGIITGYVATALSIIFIVVLIVALSLTLF